MLLFPIAAACTFAADQLIKKKVRKLDDEGRLPKTVLGGRVHLKRVENPGMIMGLGKDHPMLVKILPAAAVFVYVLLSWPRIRSAGALSRIGWGLLVGGAAGNAVEHIARGRVTDYIRQPDIPHKERKTWIYYNLADMTLTAGLILSFLE